MQTTTTRRRRRRKVYSGANVVNEEGEEEEEEEEEEEGLFKADAVNEEDPERDRATQVYKTCSAVLRGGGRGRKFIIYMIQGLTP